MPPGVLGGAEGGARVGSGGLELPPGDEGHEGNSSDAPPGTVSLARPMDAGATIGPELDWDADAWREVRTTAQRAGRAYIWLNLVEQRLRAVVAAALRPIYEPVHGDDWAPAAAGPARGAVSARRPTATTGWSPRRARRARSGCSGPSRCARSRAARAICSTP